MIKTIKLHELWWNISNSNVIITKKIHIFCQFCFEFFLENIYKFCYEKNLQEITVNFFVKYLL